MLLFRQRIYMTGLVQTWRSTLWSQHQLPIYIDIANDPYAPVWFDEDMPDLVSDNSFDSWSDEFSSDDDEIPIHTRADVDSDLDDSITHSQSGYITNEVVTGPCTRFDTTVVIGSFELLEVQADDQSDSEDDEDFYNPPAELHPQAMSASDVISLLAADEVLCNHQGTPEFTSDAQAATADRRNAAEDLHAALNVAEEVVAGGDDYTAQLTLMVEERRVTAMNMYYASLMCDLMLFTRLTHSLNMRNRMVAVWVLNSRSVLSSHYTCALRDAMRSTQGHQSLQLAMETWLQNFQYMSQRLSMDIRLIPDLDITRITSITNALPVRLATCLNYHGLAASAITAVCDWIFNGSQTYYSVRRPASMGWYVGRQKFNTWDGYWYFINCILRRLSTASASAIATLFNARPIGCAYLWYYASPRYSAGYHPAVRRLMTETIGNQLTYPVDPLGTTTSTLTAANRACFWWFATRWKQFKRALSKYDSCSGDLKIVWTNDHSDDDPPARGYNQPPAGPSNTTTAACRSTASRSPTNTSAAPVNGNPTKRLLIDHRQLNDANKHNKLPDDWFLPPMQCAGLPQTAAEFGACYSLSEESIRTVDESISGCSPEDESLDITRLLESSENSAKIHCPIESTPQRSPTTVSIPTCSRPLSADKRHQRSVDHQLSVFEWSVFDSHDHPDIHTPGFRGSQNPLTYCIDASSLEHSLLTAANANREFLAHAVFVDNTSSKADVPCSQWKQICALWDSASNTCLISPRIVKSHWQWVSRNAEEVIGVGGRSTTSRGIVMVPLQLVHSGKVKLVCCTVIDFHKIIDILFGLDYQFTHACIFDPSNFRVYDRLSKETVRLDYINKVKARLMSPPIHFLSICGGMDPAFGMALNMGFRVAKYFSYEKYDLVRQVAAAIYPDIVHLEPHDFMLVKDFSVLITMLLAQGITRLCFTTGFPCTPWSRLSNNPPGFAHPLAQLVIRGGELLALLRKSGILWTVLNETVVPHEDLVGDLITLERIMGVKYLMHNAYYSGSIASRPRLLGLEGASVEDMPVSTHVQPNFVLNPGWNFKNMPVECLVAAGDDTRSPVWLVSRRSKDRHPTADERDRINPGSPAGASTGYGAVPLQLKQRQRMTGNAFSNDMLWAVMFQWKLTPTVSTSTMISSRTPLCAMPPRECQQALSMLTAPELFALFSSMVKPDFMPRIPIFVKKGHGIIPFQTRAPGTVPAKLQVSADYQVARMLRAGTHKVIDYSPDIWLMLLFWKSKLRSVTAEFDGPNWKKGDELIAVRPLVDFRASNAAQYYPPWLIEWAPDNRYNIGLIPPGTTHFADHDSSDAYHSMKCTEEAKRMGCSKYKNSLQQDVILEPQCCQQGQAASAAYFSPWVRFGYTQFIGQNHIHFFLDFSDDSLAFGNGEEECLLRYNILGCMKVIMGLHPQLKRSPSCSTEKYWAGLQWSVKGICISDTATQAIIAACSITPRGTTQMRRLRGMIQSGILGFDLSAGQLRVFVDLMAPINAAITEAEASGKYLWPSEAKEAQAQIALKMTNSPKAYTHPDRVIDESHSILQLGDGDPKAVCSGIISVPVADARDITLDMIHSGAVEGCVLVAMYFQTLNKHQQKWGMYEIETFAHVVCHRKSHKYINELMSKFTCLPPSKGADSEISGGAHVAKLKYASDNTTALGNIPSFIIPEGKIDHLTAKFQRFCGWCEEFAVTIYWPVCFMTVLGDQNSMFDTLVRITAALKARLPGIEQDPDDVDHTIPAGITLICEQESTADIQSLLCTSEEPTCDCGDCIEAVMTYSTETLVNTRSDSHGGGMHEPTLYPSSCDPELASAPAESAGNVGFSDKTLPDGLHIHYLGLTQDKWQTLIMMYSRDTTTMYAGIKVCDIYQTLMSTSSATQDCSAKDVATIRSWLNKLFFLIDVGVPGMPALFTPSSQARNTDSAKLDCTKLLVPVIPDLVPVRLSTRSLTLAPLDETAPKWSRNFLREDILWIAHYRPTPHASKSATINNAMSQAWWPAIEACAIQVRKYCAICTQDLEVERNVGIGIRSTRRFVWLVMDDKLLPASVTAVTSYVSVLSMVDPASGATMYRLRKTMGALEASAIVFCNWICRYGIPQKLSSDNHGAFKAEVAKLICEILGVENRIFSAVYQSRSQAHVENRNKIISDTLNDAEAKGDITCDLDIELYVAEAEMKAHQLVITDGTTAFERCNGEPPRTVNASLSAPGMEAEAIEGCIERMNKIDADLVSKIYSRCNSMMEFKAIQSDKRARYNRAQLLSKESKRVASKFKYVVGEMVSYGGRKVTLDSLEPAGSENPTTCWVTDRTGKSLHVRIDSLRPLSVDVAEKLMPKGTDWKRLDNFIVFDTPDGISGGVITDVDNLAVHDWMPVVSKTGVIWAPVWSDKDNKNPARWLKCPEGHQPHIVAIKDDEVICDCELHARKFTVATVSRLENLGYDQFTLV